MLTADGKVDVRSGATAARPSVASGLGNYGMFLALLIVLVAAQIVYPGFWQWGNLQNVFSQNAALGVMAVGMTLVMIAGGFDLSVGSVYSCGAVAAAALGTSLPLWVAVAGAVLLGALLGSINGFLITSINVNPFITTLGTGFVFGGLAFIATDSAPIIVADPGFQELGQGYAIGLPVLVWVAIGVFALGGSVLALTVYGKSLYAVGGSVEAARLCGLRVDLLRLSTYALLGGCAGLAGSMIASRIGVGQADVGANVTLQVIAVVVIGGTSLFGGEGAMWRTVVGLLMIAVINNVSDSLGWTSNLQGVITGLVVITAVALDSLARRRRLT